MLKRKFYDFLLDWKRKPNRKPLLVKGARQVGKTFLVERFGRAEYAGYVYLNFLERPDLVRIFEGSLDADAVYSRLSLTLRDARIVPGNTLLFLDEIQECGEARTALKFLAGDRRCDIVASGSLLGIQYKNVRSVPVGYEEHATMHSLDFEEFLWAKGFSDDQLAPLRESFVKREKVDDFVNSTFLAEIRDYMAVGGMPEVVSAYAERKNYGEVDEIQRRILRDYLDDMMNYAPLTEKPKVKNCFLSIPRQLARETENRKFKFSEVEKGGGGRKFGNSVEWLRDSSMADMAHNVTAPLFPLAAYEDESAFKLYLSDIGLLTALYGFDMKAAVVDGTLKGSVKGGLYENLVASMLVRRGHPLRYLRDAHDPLEVEFLLEKDVVPVEVKASNASTASLNRVLGRDDIAMGYKLTSGNVGVVGKKITLPHYMAMFL